MWDEVNSFALKYMGEGEDGHMLTIFSPDRQFNIDYPKNTLCFYSVPPCPAERPIHHLQWDEEKFNLEEANDFGFINDFCSDLVRLETRSDRRKLADNGARLENIPGLVRILGPENVLCGDQGGFDDQNGGVPPSVS